MIINLSSVSFKIDVLRVITFYSNIKEVMSVPSEKKTPLVQIAPVKNIYESGHSIFYKIACVPCETFPTRFNMCPVKHFLQDYMCGL